MGASTSFRAYKASVGIDEIKELWKDAVAQSCYESGHSYSGEIGMLGPNIKTWRDLNFGDRNVADEYICDHHQKWDGAMAVTFFHRGEKYWLIGGWCSS